MTSTTSRPPRAGDEFVLGCRSRWTSSHPAPGGGTDRAIRSSRSPREQARRRTAACSTDQVAIVAPRWSSRGGWAGTTGPRRGGGLDQGTSHRAEAAARMVRFFPCGARTGPHGRAGPGRASGTGRGQAMLGARGVRRGPAARSRRADRPAHDRGPGRRRPRGRLAGDRRRLTPRGRHRRPAQDHDEAPMARQPISTRTARAQRHRSSMGRWSLTEAS